MNREATVSDVNGDIWFHLPAAWFHILMYELESLYGSQRLSKEDENNTLSLYKELMRQAGCMPIIEEKK